MTPYHEADGVGLLDCDQTGFPNLALMKISAWLKREGHRVSLNSGRLAYVSVVFTWNCPRWLPNGVDVGGSGYDLKKRLPAEIEAMRPDYSLYGIDYGMGFLTRGCPRRCPFCIVPEKEGMIRVVANLDDLINPGSSFVVLLDNNFLAIEDWAKATLQEMAERRLDVCFTQGLDIRYVTDDVAHLLRNVRFWNLKRSGRQLTFAFDTPNLERVIRRGVQMLGQAGIPSRQLQFFVLVGYDTTLEEDLARIAIIRELGADPFVMVYRDRESGKVVGDRILRDLARWVNRRLYKVCAWDEYKPRMVEARRAGARQAVMLL